MKTKVRYALLLASSSLLLLLWLVFRGSGPSASLPAAPVAVPRAAQRSPASALPNCSLESCFNWQRCRGRPFRVHVHPPLQEQIAAGADRAPKVSQLYLNILRAVRESAYYTEDASEACVFLLAYDTTDRDPKSNNYVRNLQGHIKALEPSMWDGGRNHLLFNLYPGTFPSYDLLDLGFPVGQAMLAKASTTEADFRRGFDVAFPLFHPEHPLRAYPDTPNDTQSRYLLSFKGKRYVYGMGSETRNALHHVHNGRDVLLLTSCRHGNDWEALQDKRCAQDNRDFDGWEYSELMSGSAFCLVPRGRRPDSFRFLEALASGCVPVVLSDGWRLPFSSVLPWHRAVVRVPESQLFTLSELLRSIPKRRVQEMKRVGQRLYSQYLASVDRIVRTTLELVKDRIGLWGRKPAAAWSSPIASGLFHQADLGLPPPFEERAWAGPLELTVALRVRLALREQLLRWMAEAAAKVTGIKEFVVLWEKRDSVGGLPDVVGGVALRAVDRRRAASAAALHERFAGDAVLFLDEGFLLSAQELGSLIAAWRSEPWQLVGLEPRVHVWDVGTRQWTYSSRRLPGYSILTDSALLVHRYYLRLLGSWAPPWLQRILSQAPECGDLALNVLVAEATGRPPLAVAPLVPRPQRLDAKLFRTRCECLSAMSGALAGRLPLRWAQPRPDLPAQDTDDYADFADDG